MPEFLDFAIEIAKNAGKILMDYYGKPLSIEFKGGKEMRALLTEADKASDEYIKNAIIKKYPNHRIITEESGYREPITKGEYKWIIDPLDGTSNYARGVPYFSVSIALLKDKPIIGVVYAPYYDDLYCAEKGSGAFFINEKHNIKKRMHVSEVKELENTIISYDIGGESHIIEKASRIFYVLKTNVLGSRVSNSLALDLSYVACGRYDAAISVETHPWDVAAASLIIKESGGKITDFYNNELGLNRETLSVLASNKKIHDEVLKTIRNFYKY